MDFVILAALSLLVVFGIVQVAYLKIRLDTCEGRLSDMTESNMKRGEVMRTWMSNHVDCKMVDPLAEYEP